MCGKILSGCTEIPMVAHTPETVAEVPASCTAKGKTAGTKCSVCGEILSGCTEIPMVNHTAKDVAEVPATCTEAGKTAGTKCSVCGTVLTGCDEIPASHHIVSYEVAPTCNATGVTGGKKCDKCGYVADSGKVVPKVAHKYNTSNVCVYCGAKKPVSTKQGLDKVPKTGDVTPYAVFALGALTLFGGVAVCRRKELF